MSGEAQRVEWRIESPGKVVVANKREKACLRARIPPVTCLSALYCCGLYCIAVFPRSDICNVTEDVPYPPNLTFASGNPANFEACLFWSCGWLYYSTLSRSRGCRRYADIYAQQVRDACAHTIDIWRSVTLRVQLCSPS